MFRITRSLAILMLAVLTVGSITSSCSAQRAPKLKPTVTFATTWDSAVAEAKLLNLPIVLHSHGFN